MAGSAENKERARGVKARDAFRTISEVADHLGLAQHVLRFWESKFTQLKPLKRGGNRRYYRPSDIRLLEALQLLLHKEGYTIRGVQKLFKEQGLKATIEAVLGDKPVEPVPVIDPVVKAVQKAPSVSKQQALMAALADAKSVTGSSPVQHANIPATAPELVPESKSESKPEVKSVEPTVKDKKKAALNDILGELKNLRSNMSDILD